jgi:hypothetical protein
LSTTLLMLSMDDGAKLLDGFADAAAIWISPAGELNAVHRKSRLELSSVH